MATPPAAGTPAGGDGSACEWKVVEDDVHNLDGRSYAGIDLLSGGVPCPPFSIAGKRLGHDDDRDLFPQALQLVRETAPRAVLLENVPGLAASRFDSYRAQVLEQLHALNPRRAEPKGARPEGRTRAGDRVESPRPRSG